ncbi:hypothetical protein C8Q73DRAFT_793816 [Cubamyces lactineus]|nr:hypothetical protein C8Q73DRAFT_793816 [Cubamyces lactineus]
MSTPADSAIISELATLATLQYCSISAIALLVYYYVITLGEEFKHYLDRKVTLATLLYVANRYIPLAFILYNTWMPYTSKHMILVNLTSDRVTSVPVLARVPMIIADLALIVITWKTQYKTYSLGRKLSTPSGLSMVLLRDGTVYFMALTVLNTLLLIFEYFEILGVGTDGHNSALVSFIEPLTAILISEFLIHLHEAADRGSGLETLTMAQSTLEFRIVGSIGASLHSPAEEALNETECSDGCEEHEDSQEFASSAMEVEKMTRDHVETRNHGEAVRYPVI